MSNQEDLNQDYDDDQLGQLKDNEIEGDISDNKQDQKNNDNNSQQQLVQQSSNQQLAEEENKGEEQLEVDEKGNIIQSTEEDQRSIYVQNVDYGSTKEDLQEHFKECGQIKRITILQDKYTGNARGGAYIEFEASESVDLAMALTDSMLRGRQIKIVPKRTNVPNHAGKRRARRPRRMSYQPYPFFSRGPYILPYRRGRGYRPY